MTYTIAYRLYLGPPAEGREGLVRGVSEGNTHSVLARLRKIAPLCWYFCHPEVG
jgi:hypothetical protein